MGVAKKHLAPSDELTGLGFAIISDIHGPADDYAPHEAAIDDHHTNFPKPAVLGSPIEPVPAGFVPEAIDSALEHVRVESTRRREHWLFHCVYAGIKLPQTVETKAAQFAYGSAGYVPDIGMGFDRRRRPERVPLSLAYRRQLVLSEAIRVECPEQIGHCLLAFVVDYGLSEAERATMYKTLSTPNNEHKRQQAHEFLLQASTRALRFMSSEFAEAWRKKELPLAATGNVGAYVCGLLMLKPDGAVNRNAVKRLEDALQAV